MAMTFVPSQFTLTQTVEQIVSQNKGREHLIVTFGNAVALGGDNTLSVDQNGNVTNGIVFSGTLIVPGPASEAALFAAALVPNEQNPTALVLEFVDE